MLTDLDSLRGLFRMAPFMVDLGIEPVHAAAGQPGRSCLSHASVTMAPTRQSSF
jgi:hypothetical protein